MSFCSNCGKELNNGAKFCSECGMPTTQPNASSAQRKLVYDGEVHKCPNCGEVLESFMSVCPSCGYEIRGAKSNHSLHELSLMLSRLEDDNQKVTLIKSYPIPNTKEDVIEFMLMATTNFSAGQDEHNAHVNKDILNAWITKINQSYQKAELLFGENQDFFKIQEIYEKVYSQIKEMKRKRKLSLTVGVLLRTIGLWVGLLLFIVASLVDEYYNPNVSVMFLGGAVVMIAGACMVGRKSDGFLDGAVGVACGLSAVLLGLFSDIYSQSILGLTGGITLIIVVIRLIQVTVHNRR